eukprot:scaffold231003_cov24-Attheya_sp.AAC.1
MKQPTTTTATTTGPNHDTNNNCDLATELMGAHNKLVALGKSTDHLPAAFWESYQRLKKEAFDGFLATWSIFKTSQKNLTSKSILRCSRLDYSLEANSNTMFEIRVAVIGYVSVGKTTVINALFGAEYGEVAMKRTTAVVNYFRVSSVPSSSSSSQDDDSIEIVCKNLSASATLKETATDNGVFRDSTVVQERAYDICLEEEPLHEMRPDTKLVIVDIPGMNEAGTSSKYKDFVNERWHSFDIVVVVMDARQGVNTEEQHALLQLVKDNLETTKNLPVLILGNKVDDPDNPEQTALLGEARAAVEQMFQ